MRRMCPNYTFLFLLIVGSSCPCGWELAHIWLVVGVSFKAFTVLKHLI